MSGGVPTVFYVAPYTTDIAAAEADEIGGASLVGAFALDGIELLHYGEGVTCGREGCGSGDRHVIGAG
jgi:hypothetical protein